MSVHVKLEEGLKRAWLTVLPEPQTTTIAATILQLTKQRPTLGSWDWIIDLRKPHTQATSEELDNIAAAFNAVTSKQSYTIFVSNDPSAHDGCERLAQRFLHRRHLAAKSLAEAKALLPKTMHSI
ncbi:MAG: hypothetical protein JHC81_01525 [Brevundimonas sp.]|uniref:hypothetical protein n=1 Tax=Brevundimonas sp. TaxID=1871086 RepID=UPI001A303B55|nr:hypothetical protein [Brevundimonas sp.]MBJ7446187.1 hypothetical protein [Brevundimonas sp.]